MLDSDPRCRRVGHRHQYRVRLDAVRALSIERAVAVVGRCRAAQCRADEYASRRALLVAEFERGIAQGLLRSDERELTDAIEHAQPRRGEVRARVEGRRRGDARAEPCARLRQDTDAGAARDEAREELLGIVAAGRDYTQAGDRDSLHRRYDPVRAAGVSRSAINRSMYVA